MKPNTSNHLVAFCRWTARILGALMVLLLLIIAVGEGLPNPFAQPLAVQIGFLGLALVMAGALAGWRWDLAPGIISLMGWCLFVFVAVKSPRRLNPFIASLALPAVLLLASAFLELRTRNRTIQSQ